MTITKRTITFTDCNKTVSIDLNIDEDNNYDFWVFAKGYKVHYCEDYNQICVYRDDDSTYQTIYKVPIK